MPVAVEHKRLQSSVCKHLHKQVQRCAVKGTQNKPRRKCNDPARRCEPREGAPWGRSASGRGAQEVPVVQLRTLAHGTVADAGEQNHILTDSFASSCPRFEMLKMERPGATLRARGKPCSGTPVGRSASGHGAQATPVVRLRTL